MLTTPDNYYLRKPVYLDNPHGWIPHIPFAFYLVETMKPATIVELGTYSGNSYFAFCQVVKELRLPTRCFAVDTWQGDMHVGKYGAEVYKRVKKINDKQFSAFSELIAKPFDDALPRFADGSIDLLHIDGTHTYDAVKNDFTNWFPKLKKGGIVLLHDTIVRKTGFGVWKFLQKIKERYLVFEFAFSEGLAVVCKDDYAHRAVIDFIEQANNDPTISRFFETLGFNILLAREKALFRDEVLRMRKKNAMLNSKIMEQQREIKQLFLNRRS